MYDAVVIGAGPGGYVCAIRLAQLGLKTACIEKNALGGTCLNVGCIPSKSLLQSTEHYHELTHAFAEHGIHADNPTFNFSEMQKRKEGVVATFVKGIGGLLAKNKVTHIQGEASFLDPNTLQVGEETIQAKHIIIATGSTPTSLPFLPIDEETIVSSTGALAWPNPPESLIVIGGGIIGVELGSVYARLGTKVTVVEYLDRITPTMDKDLSKELQKLLTSQGIQFELSQKVVNLSGTTITTESGSTFTAEKILVAIGRKPYTDNLKLENAHITPNEKGQIPINGAFQTSEPHIYAIGDVVDGPMLAHKASEEGVAVAELIAGQSPHLEYITIPSVVYTSPEVASVGFTEQDLTVPYIAHKFPFKANSRAKAAGHEQGFVKLLAHKETGHILGGHIIGAHAGELIHEIALALRTRSTLHTIATTSHAHPTLAEAIKEAAMDLPLHT